jgi:hypothetical protein
MSLNLWIAYSRVLAIKIIVMGFLCHLLLAMAAVIVAVSLRAVFGFPCIQASSIWQSLPKRYFGNAGNKILTSRDIGRVFLFPNS